MKKLSEQDISDYKEARKAFKKKENEIVKRINYIVKTFCKACGEENCDWQFYYEEEKIDLTEDWIEVIMSPSLALTMINKHGEEIDLENDFPIRWLIEDFEQELIDGIELYNRSENKKKEKEELD